MTEIEYTLPALHSLAQLLNWVQISLRYSVSQQLHLGDEKTVHGLSYSLRACQQFTIDG